MKVERKVYKGIEYVLVAELPLAQRDQLLQTLSPDHFIKILVDGTIISQCLQYKDYSSWFDNVFKTKTLPVKEVVTERVTITASNLALEA
jgi:hypothetical protein